MALPEITPLEVVLGNPEKVQPLISPDGKRMAYIAPVKRGPGGINQQRSRQNVFAGVLWRGDDVRMPVTW